MADWLDAIMIRRPVLFSKTFREAVLLFIAIYFQYLTRSYAQPGFLSIDCGSNRTAYTDSNGLEWVNDSGFIRTGNSFQQSVNSSILGETQHLQTFRYFPEPLSKYCYVLRVPDDQYLIRVRFYMEKSLLSVRKPFQFILFIDTNNWFTLSSGEDSQEDLFISQEAIYWVNPYSNVTNLCIQPVVGISFISSLELRPLPSSVYNYSDATNSNNSYAEYLTLYFRYNLGANSTTPDVRFPDDSLDRIWENPDVSWAKFWETISRPTAPDNTTGANIFYVPPEVMKDAWLIDAYAGFAFGLSVTGEHVSKPGAQQAYAAIYAENLVPDTRPYVVEPIIWLNYNVEPFTVSNKANMSTALTVDIQSNEFLVQFYSTQNVSLNAFEVYGRNPLNLSVTEQTDIAVITLFKESFSLSDWEGDPCLPVPYDWLSCGSVFFSPCTLSTPPVSYDLCSIHMPDDTVTQLIYTLTLSHLQESGFSDLVQNLTEITAENGPQLPFLNTISITNSGVNKQILSFLITNLSGLQYLRTLDFSYNAIVELPPTNEWLNASYLESLNLSQNRLTGPLSALQGLPFNPTLQVLDVSHNNLSDTFPSSLGFLDFLGTPNLTVAVFDNNSIGGTLNLTAWYTKLQQQSSQNSSKIVTRIQFFSFVNNMILDIIPNADAFQSVMNLLSNNTGGILLGGNPYCQGAKSYTQRYLCRTNIHDKIENDTRNQSTILIVSLCVGVVALVVLVGIFLTLRKLWMQVYALRQIQQALEERKVQPPFYQYNELKSATQDFHKDNKLGQGGFGVVYKGVLGDNTMLAVKKLFISRKEQVLNEFLNEVVLITGIKHRNLVQLKGCCITDKVRILVYEYVENGNLADALWGTKPHGVLNWDRRFNICLEVANGICYLHEYLQPSIIHRDIKPENIILDKNLRPKIADFGLARHFSDESRSGMGTRTETFAGTFGYVSPEYFNEGLISEKLDVYSYGIVVLEIIYGRKCIDQSLSPDSKFIRNWVCKMYEKGLAKDVLQPELRDDSVVDHVMRTLDIGLACVELNPAHRPSMAQVVAMLSGNMPVKVFSNFSGNACFNFSDILISTVPEMPSRIAQSVISEEISELPLVDRHTVQSVIEEKRLEQSSELPLADKHRVQSVIEEESSELPLLDTNSQKESGSSGDRGSSKSLVEMSDFGKSRASSMMHTTKRL